AKALVTIKQNQYSVPVGLAGLRVSARVGAREIEIRHDGRLVACHRRLDGRFEITARLDHYLELLALKPGALGRSLALRQERERGAWPDCYDELWHAIKQKTDAGHAARQMVDVLMLIGEHGPAKVELAVRGALTAGAYDGRAVAVLADRAERPAPAPLEGLDGRLQATERPAPDLQAYDQLLGGEGSC
ncbi:MAG: IS21 family transposase, partial [Actinobacteria bacterium]|nr:IS21 family transposase [Actinomycetota bacterium]